MIPSLRNLAAGTVAAAILAPTVAACGDLEVHSVYMALDGNGERRRSGFFTDTTSIFCDADYASSRMDITFNAVIRQTYDPKGGPVPQTEPGTPNADIVTAIGELDPGVGHGIISMQWNRPMDPMGGGMLPFAAGWYKCELMVDGIDPATGVRSSKFPPIVQGKASFKIDYINCPVAGVDLSKGPELCRGYVIPNSSMTCKGTDASKAYKCDETTGLWTPL